MAAAKRLTKSQVVAEIADAAELDKKSVSRVFEVLADVIKKQLGSRGPGEFVVPGLLKLKAVKKPATKDRPGKNPFTGEPMVFKGKPASKKIRATALKSLKDLIQLSRRLTDDPTEARSPMWRAGFVVRRSVAQRAGGLSCWLA